MYGGEKTMKEIFHDVSHDVEVTAHINKQKSLVYIDVTTPYGSGTRTTGFSIKLGDIHV